MKREISFRAWNGEKMIYGVSPFQWDFVIDRTMWRTTESNGSGFLGSGGTEAKFELTGYAYKELMQYVDKTVMGKPVYEGDILKLYRRGDNMRKEPVTGDVTFLNGCFMCRNCTWHELYKLYQSDYDVIGNIYANPELLEK